MVWAWGEEIEFGMHTDGGRGMTGKRSMMEKGGKAHWQNRVAAVAAATIPEQSLKTNKNNKNVVKKLHLNSIEIKVHVKIYIAERRS